VQLDAFSRGDPLVTDLSAQSWLRDLNQNVARATRRGVKKARLFRS